MCLNGEVQSYGGKGEGDRLCVENSIHHGHRDSSTQKSGETNGIAAW